MMNQDSLGFTAKGFIMAFNLSSSVDQEALWKC